MDETFPDTTGYTVRRICANTTCDDGQARDYTATQLQTAIDFAAANCGSTGVDIQIEKGLSLDLQGGTAYVLKTTNCAADKWILIRTMDFANLPPAGTRPCIAQSHAPPDCTADAAKMPDVRGTTVNINIFNMQANADGYRLVGLQLVNTLSAAQAYVHMCPTSTCSPATIDDVPKRFIIDRCIIEPSSDTVASGFGVILEGGDAAVVDSVIRNVWNNAQVPGESKAILISGAGRGDGPFLVRNNFLEAAGIVVFLGGAEQEFTNILPRDVTIVRNHIFRRTAWQATSSDANPGHRKKNSVELKLGRRVRFEGNVVENNWMSGQGQNAQGMVIKVSATGAGANAWSATEHIKVRFNRFLNLEGYCLDMGPTPIQTGGLLGIFGNHWEVHDNVCDGVSHGNGSFAPFGFMGFAGCPSCPQAAGDRISRHIGLRHNTVISSARVGGGNITAGWQGVIGSTMESQFTRCTDAFAAHDNAMAMTREGSTANLGNNQCSINSVRVDEQAWSNDWNSWHGNLMTNAGASACDHTTGTLPLANKPWAQFESGCTSDQESNFTTWSDVEIGTGANNLTLKNTSPGFEAASDAAARTAAGLSTDVGADIAKVNLETCGTLSGDWSCLQGGGQKRVVPRGRAVPK